MAVLCPFWEAVYMGKTALFVQSITPHACISPPLFCSFAIKTLTIGRFRRLAGNSALFFLLLFDSGQALFYSVGRFSLRFCTRGAKNYLRALKLRVKNRKTKKMDVPSK
jgi:hypothetical protein